MIIGWQQTSYSTPEGTTTAVCAQVLAGLGTIGTRTFQVDYEAQNGQAVGECTAELVCIQPTMQGNNNGKWINSYMPVLQ